MSPFGDDSSTLKLNLSARRTGYAEPAAKETNVQKIVWISVLGIVMLVLAILYGGERPGLSFNLTVGQNAHVRYEYDCPKSRSTPAQDEMPGKPYKFETQNDNLPPGLQLDGDQGGLNGIPTATGKWHLQLSVVCAYEDNRGSQWVNNTPYGGEVIITVRQ